MFEDKYYFELEVQLGIELIGTAVVGGVDPGAILERVLGEVDWRGVSNRLLKVNVVFVFKHCGVQLRSIKCPGAYSDLTVILSPQPVIRLQLIAWYFSVDRRNVDYISRGKNHSILLRKA